ncbi:MAG: hypothetical protein KDA68_11805 [Planctomycetaceae bacterium]|nr:hypothetical protein [Planctomycetaceae bacterium]
MLGLVLTTAWWLLIDVIVREIGTDEIEESLRLQNDGSIVIRNSNGVTRTLEGKVLSRQEVSLDHSLPFGFSLDSKKKRGDSRFQPEEEWRSRLLAYADHDRRTIWYATLADPTRRLLFFQGYSVPGGRRIGYIGRNGFSENLPKSEEQFEVAKSWGFLIPRDSNQEFVHGGMWNGREYFERTDCTFPLLITSDRRLLQVNLRQLSVEEFLPEIDFISVNQENWQREIEVDGDIENETDRKRTVPEEGIQLRTESELVWVSFAENADHKKVLQKVTIPEELRERPFSWYHLKDRSGLIIEREQRHPLKNTFTTRIRQHDNEGNFATPFEVETKSFPTYYSTILIGEIVFPPLTIAKRHWEFQQREPEQRVYFSLSQMIIFQLWPLSLAVALVSGIGLMLHTRHRGNGWGEAIGWGLVGFCFGVSGIAGYLIHRRWGVRVRCPSCGRDVLLLGEKCSGCAAEFPQPELVGTEVFA